MPEGLSPYSITIAGCELMPRTCPRKLVTTTSWDWMRLHHFYKRGVLPFSGGLLEQPNRFLEAMEVLDHAEAESALRDHGR